MGNSLSFIFTSQEICIISVLSSKFDGTQGPFFFRCFGPRHQREQFEACTQRGQSLTRPEQSPGSRVWKSGLICAVDPLRDAGSIRRSVFVQFSSSPVAAHQVCCQLKVCEWVPRLLRGQAMLLARSREPSPHLGDGAGELEITGTQRCLLPRE